METLHRENRIYYYCGLDTALEFILPDKSLLLSPITKTNDPRENKNLIFGAKYFDPNDIEDPGKQNEKINKILREDCKVLCFSQDFGQCFGYELSRMWVYYGGKHKGICLLLDKSEFLKENIGIIDTELLREIKYYKFDVNNIPMHKFADHSLMKKLGAEKYLRQIFRKKYLDYLFFTKNAEWESECELRLIHFSDKKENEYCSIKNSLKHIYLGVDFHDSYLPSIINLCPDTDISRLKFTDIRLTAHKIEKSN